MKIEIELDAERIHRDVVDQLYRSLSVDLSQKIDQAMKGAVMAELATELRKQVAERLPLMTFGDGRTFGQYIQELLERKSRGDWRERGRIVQLVEDLVINEAHTLFQKVMEPHIQEFRKGLAKKIVDETLAALTRPLLGGPA